MTASAARQLAGSAGEPTITLLHSQQGASSIRRRRGSMAQDFICDPETGEIVALIRCGGVFRDDLEGAKIATVLGAYLYDLNGNIVGHLQGRNVTEATTQSMPIAFRELLKAKMADDNLVCPPPQH